IPGTGITECNSSELVGRWNGGDLDGDVPQSTGTGTTVTSHIDQPQLGRDSIAVIGSRGELRVCGDRQRSDVDDLGWISAVVPNHSIGVGIASEDVVYIQTDTLFRLRCADAQRNRQWPCHGGVGAVDDLELRPRAEVNRTLVRRTRTPETKKGELGCIVGAMANHAVLDRHRGGGAVVEGQRSRDACTGIGDPVWAALRQWA